MLNDSSPLPCKEVIPFLERFHNGTLGAELHGKVSAHILSCEDCENHYAQLVDKKAEEIPTRKIINRRFYAVVAIAASIIILIGIGYVFLQPKDIDESGEIAQAVDTMQTLIDDDEISQIDSTSIAQEEIIEDSSGLQLMQDDRVLYADNFIPDESLELMRKKNYRSTIQIVSPQDSSVFKPGEPIHFQFENEQEQLIIILLNNKKEQLAEINLEKNDHTFNDTLVPGLYYWELETEDDQLSVRRFYVKVE